MEPCTVFYSWQSDLPTKTNWGFIQSALERAVKRIRVDDSIKVEPVVDRGTQGVPGCPDIGLTILDKIKRATVFVCDVSTVAHWDDNRHTPNPNVLVELGYALGTLSWNRVILVMNKAYGPPEQLPFDLRQKLALVYESKESDTDRSEARKKLEGMLEAALREIFSHLENMPTDPPPPSAAERAIRSIEEARADTRVRCEQFAKTFVGGLESIAPDLGSCPESQMEELFDKGLADSLPYMKEFGMVLDSVAMQNSREGATGLWSGLSPLIEHLHVAPGVGGVIRRAQFDFYRFIGHECVLMVTAALMHRNQWELLATVLSEDIYVSNSHGGQQAGFVDFSSVFCSVHILENRSQRTRRLCSQADVLNARHLEGDLGGISPFSAIADADILLALRSAAAATKSWFPITCVYNSRNVPRFLIETVKLSSAKRLAKTLGITKTEVIPEIVKAIETIRDKVDRAWAYRGDISVFSQFDTKAIGSKA